MSMFAEKVLCSKRKRLIGKDFDQIRNPKARISKQYPMIQIRMTKRKAKPFMSFVLWIWDLFRISNSVFEFQKM